MKSLAAAIAAAGLLAWTVVAHAEIITVEYQARAITVAQTPFGFTIPLQTPVSGYFTFDTGTPDDAPEDEGSGEYPHDGNGGFLARFLTHEITGSETPFYWVHVPTCCPESDTFRVYDGPRTVGFEGGIMSLDGTPDPKVELFVAITEDAFDDDDLIDPFPFYQWGPFGTSHTFALEDDQGTMLLQIDEAEAVVCGDVNSGGIKASDALEVLRTSVGTRDCYPCVCDVDHNGSIVSSDALKTLRAAVSPGTSLNCSPCL